MIDDSDSPSPEHIYNKTNISLRDSSYEFSNQRYTGNAEIWNKSDLEKLNLL